MSLTIDKQTVIHNTFVIERTYPVEPSKVFAAFADAGKKRRWFIEGQYNDVREYQMDFRVGGVERAELRFKEGIPVAGMLCTTETVYHDIVPNQRLVFSSRMIIGGQCISIALVTIELLSANQGTDLLFTHQAAFFEGSDGPERRQSGWDVLFDRLTAELTA